MKTSLNPDGLYIEPRDLSTVTPGADDDGRLYNHNGASPITLIDSSTTSNEGYYMWDDTQGGWNPLKATLTNAETLDGIDSTGFVQADGSVAMTGNLDMGGNVISNVKNVVGDGTTALNLYSSGQNVKAILTDLDIDRFRAD